MFTIVFLFQSQVLILSFFIKYTSINKIKDNTTAVGPLEKSNLKAK